MSKNMKKEPKDDMANIGAMMGINHNPVGDPFANPQLELHLNERLKKEKQSERLS